MCLIVITIPHLSISIKTLFLSAFFGPFVGRTSVFQASSLMINAIDQKKSAARYYFFRSPFRPKPVKFHLT
jgi:hypothetical protein